MALELCFHVACSSWEPREPKKPKTCWQVQASCLPSLPQAIAVTVIFSILSGVWLWAKRVMLQPGAVNGYAAPNHAGDEENPLV